MKESLSSSAPRSGDVEEDEELEALDARCIRRARDMVVGWWVGVDGMRPVESYLCLFGHRIVGGARRRMAGVAVWMTRLRNTP